MPERVKISSPWIRRHHSSSLLEHEHGPAGADTIFIDNQEIYGDPAHPVQFRIGNGGAGYTGLLRALAEEYISCNGNGFRIAWVTNHSRHSQIALLADVVQIALTYEPENENIAIDEGWARRVGRVFNDHFVLAGPAMPVEASGLADVLRAIARSHSKEDGSPLRFITRGDGSATYAKERLLWKAAEVDTSGADWIETFPGSPYDTLVKAEQRRALLLTDRSTFLTAKEKGVIPSLMVHAEGGSALLNPCSALVMARNFYKDDESLPMADAAAAKFADWLLTEQAQSVVEQYGRTWNACKPLFTPAQKEEFEDIDLLSGS